MSKAPKAVPPPTSPEGLTKDVLKTIQANAAAGATPAPSTSHGNHDSAKKDTHDNHTPSHSGGGGRSIWKRGWEAFSEGDSFAIKLFRWLVLILLFSLLANEIQLYYQKKQIESMTAAMPLIEKMQALQNSSTGVQKKQDKAPAPNVHDGNVVNSSTSVVASSFACPTKEDVENGFAQLLRSQFYHDVPTGKELVGKPGCFLLKTSNEITKLDGALYQFAVPDPAIPGNFYLCGDGFEFGNGDLETCKAFLAKHAGTPIRVIIKDGGFVKMKGN